MNSAAKGSMTYKNLGDQEISDLVKSAILQPDLTKRAKIYEKVLNGTLFVVERLTKKYADFPAHEDLQQVGRYALYRAILSFKPDKCPKFYGWAVRWIKKNIAIAAFKTKKYFAKNDFTDDALSLASSAITEFTPEDVLLEKERNMVLWKAVSETGYIGSQILISVYCDDAAEVTCALSAGISRRKLDNVKNLALKTLRNNAELIRIMA